jgi:multicomponent Na+:H+ antiporter subunit C
LTLFLVYGGTGVVLFAMGLHRLVTAAHLVRKLIATHVMAGGVFLLLVATAHRDATEAPDPVPHAMVLTGIVVAVGITAFASALIRRLHAATGSATLDETERGDGS